MNRNVLHVIVGIMFACQAVAAAPPGDDPRVTPIVRAYRKVRPAVVNVSTERVVSSRMGAFGRDPFEDIFSDVFGRRLPVKSLGSGFVLHPSGYIVTNAHVVRRAEIIKVTLPDRKEYPARVISADRNSDLAVLKIEPPKGKPLPYLPLGRSDDLMVGETVIAIGNAMGYTNSLTTGVISATDRTLKFSGGITIGGLIQTDAPINPGNSGGPLLNVKGELIGINTAIRADAQNIGFAIPVSTLSTQLVSLLDFERINRVVLGATVAQKRDEKGPVVLVESVRPGTPAYGKLKKGDRIVALNGTKIRQIPDYVCGMLAVKSGSKVRFLCLRAGKEIEVSIVVRAKPRPDGNALARKLFGVTLRQVTPALARDLRLRVARGLLVVGVEEGGPADRLGVKLRDVLFQVGRFYVADMETLGIILEEIGPGKPVTIGVVRGNVRAWATIHTRKGKRSGASGSTSK